MILTALNQLYERKSKDPSSGIPPLGFSEENISFAFVLSRDGELLNVIDLRDANKGKPKPKRIIVPAAVKRTVGVSSNFLWDNTGYVLGVDSKGKGERSNQTHQAFKELHKRFSDGESDEGLSALLSFLKSWEPKNIEFYDNWAEIQDTNIVFRLESDDGYLHERPALVQKWQKLFMEGDGGEEGQCLLTGRIGKIASLHPSVKGVNGAQSTGAAIVSFNLPSFTSYGKEQNLNAPVGELAAFGYTTALNWLLREENGRKIRLGDSTVVFWAERDTPAENLLSMFLNPALPPSEKKSAGPVEDPKLTTLVRGFLEAAQKGRPIGEVDPSINPDERFYILGLSPNNARISVRYWNVSNFGGLVERIARHYADMRIEPSRDTDPEYIPPWLLLLQTAPQGKTDNIPPLLGGALMRSILMGESYPQGIYTAVLGRIRADREINYTRASLIKAVLTRNHGKEIPMSLDTERIDPGYRLGRLFALLEKVQQDATNAKAGIRERYFGAASATPRSVFPQLLRTGQHHLSKAEYGGHVDRQIQSVMEGLNTFPTHLSLEEQGLFTIGYYHQKNALYRKKEEV